MERADRELHYPNSTFALTALAVFAFLGFWRNYFSVLSTASIYAHVHGIAMSSWLVLLIVQAWLIRTNVRGLHRTLGLVSYVLVPIIVGSSLVFSHRQLGARGLERGSAILYVQLSDLLLFVAPWALAMYRRKSPVLHTRYMVCTAIACIEPIFFRIFNRYLWPGAVRPSWVSPQFFTYGLTIAVFIWLISSNPQLERKLGVYPQMLLLFVALQIPTFLLADTELWQVVARAFLELPLG